MPLQVLNGNAPSRPSAPKAPSTPSVKPRVCAVVRTRAASPEDNLPFSLDIMLEILKLCSPYEIALFTTLSRQFRAFIAANPRVWEHSCLNFARGTCDAVPTRPVVDEDVPGNFSWAAYAMYIFGPKTCSICKRSGSWLRILPFNWSLKLNACVLPKSTEGPDGKKMSWCGYVLKRDYVQSPIDMRTWKSVTPDVGPQWIGFFDELDFNPASEVVDRRTLKIQKRMVDTSQLMQNAAFLTAWSCAWLTEIVKMAKENLAFIGDMALKHKISRDCILLSPTMERVFCAFNRDIERLTVAVWEHFRPQILSEARALRDGPMERCSYCSKSFTTKEMLTHLITKHKRKGTPTLSLPDGRQNCISCPKSARFYTKRQLDRHRLKQHN
ncbi:hypothetical protein MKEN_01367300 [Mycena kentingensis (nom. inval.)]|nr:hypothetical protein MKEN_01367300 [Mycena kentingensis (nom. inval.)]